MSTGRSQADWVPVSEMLPAQGTLVLIAYQFMDDDYLTVDVGERDGDRWLYIGGGPILDGDVHLWAFPPDVPALPGVVNGLRPDGLVELAA